MRMGEATFPLYAVDLRWSEPAAGFAGFKDRAILTFNGVRVRITAATYDDAPNVSSSEDLKFTPTIGTIENDTKALRRQGADSIRGDRRRPRPGLSDRLPRLLPLMALTDAMLQRSNPAALEW